MICPFDLNNKNKIIEFEETDPYNPKNTLKGVVNRRQGQLYGSLYITHVNDKPCPQVIYSAPKQHYPFNKNDEWKFPECDSVELYTKIDGTCVISYTYKDEKGHRYLTYKTRLRPFLGAGKFGNFFELWNEMRERYPKIDEMCFAYKYNFVFELYGKRNKILIDYDVPLDTRLLFAVHQETDLIYSPTVISKFNTYNVPLLVSKRLLSNWHNSDLLEKIKIYRDIQAELESQLEIDEENKIMKGEEGVVWYFIKVGSVQIKNKPPSVLKYHWSGDAIAYESIYTTVINAFENFDNPSHSDIVGLLKEEFDDEKIEKSRVRIEKILGRVTFDKKLQYELAKDYNKLGVNINEDKATVMRWFGENYPKSQAKRIYNLLKQYEEK